KQFSGATGIAIDSSDPGCNAKYWPLLVARVTPLQYQKNLRLQEARRLLFAEKWDAATVSHRVGYESPLQFNREYHRLFGLPPVRDLAQLRANQQQLVNA